MALLDLMFQTATSAFVSALGLKTQIGLITVDVAISMEHSRTAEVMEHPIESGFSIADHVVLPPAELIISGLVTDTPLFMTGINLGTARSSATFHMLNAMMDARLPTWVLTPQKIYPAMMITRLSVPKTREAAIRFECTLREIRTVFAQNVALPPTAEVAAGKGVSKLTVANVANPSHAIGTTGIQSTTQPPPSPRESILHKIFG